MSLVVLTILLVATISKRTHIVLILITNFSFLQWSVLYFGAAVGSLIGLPDIVLSLIGLLITISLFIYFFILFRFLRKRKDNIVS
jgi:hypothetical protein